MEKEKKRIGFLENNETIADGTKREALEEAGVRVEMISLYTLLDLPHVSQVYLIFRAHLLNGDFHPGEESLEVKLFSEGEIPWNELAFTSIQKTLKLYYMDRPSGLFPLHRVKILA